MSYNLIEINKQQIISESDTFTPLRYRLFLKYLYPSHKTLLDFGCNTGRGGVVLKSFRSDLILTGADIVSERLESIPTNIYYEIVDLSLSPFSDIISNFDAIVSGEVVEHIPFTDLINYLRLFYDRLNTDGLLLLTTPNPDSFLVKLGRDSVLTDSAHINIMSRDFLQTILEKIGFKNIIIKGCGKATKYFGDNFPIFNIYGSYLVIAHK